jgi:hypothetical protein
MDVLLFFYKIAQWQNDNESSYNDRINNLSYLSGAGHFFN